MQRSVEKCASLIDRHMRKIDAQKISIPNLTSAALWRESGRIDVFEKELFVTKDREGSSLVLGPVSLAAKQLCELIENDFSSFRPSKNQ